jgi:hypothetical protein
MVEVPDAEAIVYFRDVPGGSSAQLSAMGQSRDFGHVFVEVVDHGTGRSDYYDFWTEGGKGEGILNSSLNDSRREEHWQAHIPVSREAAGCMLDAIEAARAQSQVYRPTGLHELLAPQNTCVTGTAAVLAAGDINVGAPMTPQGLWGNLQEQLGAQSQPYGISEVRPPETSREPPDDPSKDIIVEVGRSYSREPYLDVSHSGIRLLQSGRAPRRQVDPLRAETSCRSAAFPLVEGPSVNQ